MTSPHSALLTPAQPSGAETLSVIPSLPGTTAVTRGTHQATIDTFLNADGLRSYEISSTAPLRDNKPAEKKVRISEIHDAPRVRTGNPMFDGLYAMAVQEARQLSVSEIRSFSYAHNSPIPLQAFETGELWNYVWTRDLAYAVHLSLAAFDPARAASSLLFKSSTPKDTVTGGYRHQMIQDTGSGGSYPVSTDRVVWAIGAHETLKYLSGEDRAAFFSAIFPVLCDTIEQDRRLVFDPADGLYRGEHSFLDWRQQTYPGWTRDNVLAIALSKAVSVNAACYFLLKTAGEYAAQANDPDRAARYTSWAAELKEAINARLFDAEAGLYRTYLLPGERGDIPVARYDLLGQCLAILFGVADEAQAAKAIQSYPTGVYGPPVIWPNEKSVPIYHNQGIWPFVTAYWVKAAQKAGNVAAVNAGIRSLHDLAALNLSNMENFDFVTGLAHVTEGVRIGPSINSRRQLWSVAGYLSMVQDAVFGMETSMEGIRFQPFITAQMRRDFFAGTQTVELQAFSYRGTRHLVRVHLPDARGTNEGVFRVESVLLNGAPVVPGTYVPVDSLAQANVWEIQLTAPESHVTTDALWIIEGTSERELFGPVAPEWNEDGVEVQDGRLVLRYHHADTGNVRFNIYRNSQLAATGVEGTTWTDPVVTDLDGEVASYAVEAVDPLTGTRSHLTTSRSYRKQSHRLMIPAKAMENRGGVLVDGHHYEEWGKTGDELWIGSLVVELSGQHRLEMEFANGSGPEGTGITCAVKKLEVRVAESGELAAAGYLIMPQSGSWKRFDLSSAVTAQLEAGVAYTVRILEDEYSRNMSYLKNNEFYTQLPGGGPDSYNFVHIAALHVSFVSSSSN